MNIMASQITSDSPVVQELIQENIEGNTKTPRYLPFVNEIHSHK